MNKENLQRMADHIRTIPQEMFGMGDYRTGDRTTAECDSVGCILGHCTVLETGEFPRFTSGSIDFTAWEESFTGTSDDEWNWCFSDNWSETDNTPEGAALRIEWLIKNGLPEDWEQQMNVGMNLSYYK